MSFTRKPGDWDCSCKEINFGSRTQCRKCGAPKPQSNSTSSSGGAPPVRRRDGDWDCSCKELNFASRTECRKCGAPKPQTSTTQSTSSSGGAPVRRKEGDWDCPDCNFVNFKSRDLCKNCQTPNPNRSSSSSSGPTASAPAAPAPLLSIPASDQTCFSVLFKSPTQLIAGKERRSKLLDEESPLSKLLEKIKKGILDSGFTDETRRQADALHVEILKGGEEDPDKVRDQRTKAIHNYKIQLANPDVWGYSGQAFALILPTNVCDWPQNKDAPHITVIFLGKQANQNNLNTFKNIALTSVREAAGATS